MKIIREVRNVLDGKYTVREEERESKNRGAGGLRENESRVVRKLLDLGLAVPQNGEAKPKKHG